MIFDTDFGHDRIMTKTDRRAKRRANAIEGKRHQQASEEPLDDETIELTKEERQLLRAERVHDEIKEQRIPMRLDASSVTNYIGSHDGGVIKGISLEQLYKRLAVEALDDTSKIGTWRAEVAVAYACCSNWLIRKETAGASEWMYSIPEVAPDCVDSILPLLAQAA